jgi:hypothetical protein
VISAESPEGQHGESMGAAPASRPPIRLNPPRLVVRDLAGAAVPSQPELEHEAVNDAQEVLSVVESDSTQINGIVVPSEAALMRVLDEAESPEKLARVEKIAATLIDVARRCDHMVGQLSKLLTFRLRSRHRLGLAIIATVRAGGRRTKGQKAESDERSLPKNLDKAEARKCREIARIPMEVLEDYFAAVESKGLHPSEAGAHRFARAARAAKDGRPPATTQSRRRPTRVSSEIALTPEILDCVQRTLGHIDVCVGHAEIRCSLKVSASTVKVHDIQGTVFVAGCLDPEDWLPKLAKLHRAAKVTEALVVLPGTIWLPWYRAALANGGGWEWCVLTSDQPTLAVAHLGRHPQGFRVAFSSLGAVVSSAHPSHSPE